MVRFRCRQIGRWLLQWRLFSALLGCRPRFGGSRLLERDDRGCSGFIRGVFRRLRGGSGWGGSGWGGSGLLRIARLCRADRGSLRIEPGLAI